MAWDTDRRPDVLLQRVSNRPGSFRQLRGHTIHSGPVTYSDIDNGPDLTAGACVSFQDDRMFRGSPTSVARAKIVCQPCPVKAPCLKAAMDRGDTHGVWGGLSPSERRSLTSYGSKRSLELEASRR